MENEENIRLPLLGLKALWPFLNKYKGLLIRMVVLGLVVSFIDAAYPLFNRYALNHYVGYKTLDTLPVFIGTYLLVLLSQVVINYINVCDCARIELYMDRDMRDKSFAHLQTLSLSYYNQNNVGYIHARVMSDAGKIGEMVAWRMMDIIWYGSYIIFVIAVMMITNLRLAVYILLLVPAAVLLIIFFQRKLLKWNRKVREVNSRITGDFNEGITSVKTIKSLVVEDKLEEDFYKDTKDMYKKSVRTGHYSALFGSTVTLMSAVALSMVMWKGGNLTVDNMMEIGTLSIFMSYALGILEPVQNLINTISGIFAIQVNIERFTGMVNTRSEVYDRPEVIEKYGDSFNPRYENWEEIKGDIEFSDVTFHYPDGEELVLEHFDLKVPAGTNVAIVGETGAGKSTLVNLVCRFFEPTKGKVLIDGMDARDRSIQWLHSNIGYVLQTPHLFSGTIRDNLRYGNPDASDDEIMRSLELIGAGGILAKLKDGLDTEVGEGGDFLSMGEKQLLSISRALLADPAILILDEATSSIDTVTERLLQDAISKVIKGRTSFVIAHRLSTIINADIILLVSDGKIVERGTHKELMDRKGAYYKLYSRQFEDMLVEKVFNDQADPWTAEA